MVIFLSNVREKSTNPYLRALTILDRGYLGIRENIEIPLPSILAPSAFHDKPKTPIKARLYYYGTRNLLRNCDSLIFHIPGGGFVAMTPVYQYLN